MKMILRWFGEKDDSIKPEYIAQIPGVSGVASAVLDVPVGEVWPEEKIRALKERVNACGLSFEVVESVNIHEDIKMGLPSRDEKIEAYIDTMKNLSKHGIKVICYNFMPVLDWVRSDLFYDLPDGSNTMHYDPRELETITPEELAARYEKQNNGFSLSGWEPERLKTMRETLEKYSRISEDDIWRNMKYFLDAIMPCAEECDIKMAIHPDDPPWPIFGLPRVIINRDNIERFLALNPSRHNGLTLCTGSLGANPANDLPGIVREFSERIHFAHIRNLRYQDNGAFYESAHMGGCGSMNMLEIVRAFKDSGFDGYIRPDHGRMIWGETGRPGYGLYDRALGAVYIAGLWEALLG